MEQDRATVSTINHLCDVNRESERNFYAAAEQVEDRAVKLLIKAYAQERAYFVRELTTLTEQTNGQGPATEGYSLHFLQRGWMDLRAALIVRRQRRNRVLLSDLQQQETSPLDVYTQALAKPLSAKAHEIITRQAERVQTVYNRLTLLTEEVGPQLTLRLFNDDTEATEAIERLQQLGVDSNNLAIVPIETVTPYRKDEEAQPRVAREGVMTGGLFGLLFGAILGLIYGVFHRVYFPEVDGFFTSTPTAIMFEVALYGAFIGLLFSLIFSSLIMQSAAETDTFLYEDSFQNGSTLVAVFTDVPNVTAVKRAIGLKHDHEIEPVPA